MKLNDRILDETVRRQIRALLVAEGLVEAQQRDYQRDIRRALARLLRARIPELPRGRVETDRAQALLQGLMGEAEAILGAGFIAMRQQLRGELVELARREAAWARSMIEEVVPVRLSLERPTPGYLRSIAVTRPFQGRNLRQWYSKLDQDSRGRLRSRIREGLQRGESTQSMTRALLGTRANRGRDGLLDRPRHEIETAVRTAANHVSVHSKMATYEANPDIFPRWKFTATLDSRTSKTCAGLDGTVWKIGEGPLPPRHPRCRSEPGPVLAPWRDLGFDLDDLPPQVRASHDGEVPGDLTFPTWFARQPKGFQREWLGPGRYRLYRRGVDIPDMLSHDFRPLTVAQLEDRFGDVAA